MKFHLPLPGRRLRRILTLLGQAALCCILTAARLGGLYAPFSLAAAAAAGPGLPGLLSLLGVTGGALLFLDFQPGLRHAAAAVLLFAAQTAFCDTKLYRRPAFRPLTAALSQLLIQSVYLLYRPLSQWVLCLTASALLAAATALLTAHGTTLRQKGLLYAAALSLALVPVTVEGLFSVGKALLMTELLLLSRRLPPLTAGLAGACAGLAADLVPETTALLLTVAYGCGGALAAFYGRLPRILPAAAFSLPAEDVAGGVIDTDMTHALTVSNGEAMKSAIAMQTFGEPMDVAWTLAFLASDYARYITGTTLEISGGKMGVQNPAKAWKDKETRA